VTEDGGRGPKDLKKKRKNKKQTRLWTNVPLPSLVCEGPGACPQMVGTRHREHAQLIPNPGQQGHKREELYRIPQGLCDLMAAAC
jgi:hypothetical protein